jgi:hypothetical protein
MILACTTAVHVILWETLCTDILLNWGVVMTQSRIVCLYGYKRGTVAITRGYGWEGLGMSCEWLEGLVCRVCLLER